MAQYLDIAFYEPPIRTSEVVVRLYWHRRLERDPANGWLRDHMIEALDFGRAGKHVPAGG